MELDNQNDARSRSPRRANDDGDGRPVESAIPRVAVRGDTYDTGSSGKTGADGLAHFLGWFSIGLGLAQVAAPAAMSRLVGIENDEKAAPLMRAMGMREIGHGVSIFTKPRPATQVWSRVAGDALDLLALGAVMANPRNDRSRAIGATLAVLGVTVLDYYTARALSGISEDAVRVAHEPGIFTKRSITVKRPIAEVYAFWRDFENLPRFMRHLEAVTVYDRTRSHWIATGPAGRTFEWDAEITEEVENERIAWEATADSDVYNEGYVEFAPAPGDRGTEVRVGLRYEPPGGVIGSKLAMLWREEPGQQVQDDLRRFKQVMEIGEVTVSDATYRRGPHPAQPPAEV